MSGSHHERRVRFNCNRFHLVSPSCTWLRPITVRKFWHEVKFWAHRFLHPQSQLPNLTEPNRTHPNHDFCEALNGLVHHSPGTKRHLTATNGTNKKDVFETPLPRKGTERNKSDSSQFKVVQ